LISPKEKEDFMDIIIKGVIINKI